VSIAKTFLSWMQKTTAARSTVELSGEKTKRSSNASLQIKLAGQYLKLLGQRTVIHNKHEEQHEKHNQPDEQQLAYETLVYLSQMHEITMKIRDKIREPYLTCSVSTEEQTGQRSE